MKSEVKVVLLGFAPFEKSTFESFFKLVGRRDTFYKVVPEAAQAQIVMVNGDNPTAAQWANNCVKSPQMALYVGAPDPAGIWPVTSRPIKLTAVLGLLDILVKPKILLNDIQLKSESEIKVAPVLASVPVPASVPLSAPKLAPPLASTPANVPKRDEAVVANPAQAAALVPKTLLAVPQPSMATVPKNSVREGSGVRASQSFQSSSFIGLGSAPEIKVVSEQFDDILVVDDSDVALKFMQNRLTRYGFRAELARSGEEALTRLSASKFKFVFLDVMMEGIDGYQTCRAIKQRKYASGRPPVVVMLTSRGGSIDKIRGGLAGCDAYLTKPLNEVELLKILSKHDEQVERSFRDTNMAGAGMASSRFH